jgi:multisubunit Na+/H+ antiporter MnhB subunit
MSVLLKIVAVVLVAIGAFLIYAVIHAMASAGGAKTGVAIGYIVGAILLGYVASWLWRRSSRPKTAST